MYLADRAQAPYGERSLTEVRERASAVTRWLIEQGCGIVVIACNTASAAALASLREAHPGVRFVGMEPAVKPAAETSTRGRIGVVATAATFQSELFASVVDRFAEGVEVTTSACPSWVTLVEAGQIDGPQTEAEVRACLQPLIRAEVDVVVLACTHYPALLPVIRAVMGEDVTIVDPAPAVARQAARVAEAVGVTGATGTTTFVTTAEPEVLDAALARLGIDGRAMLLALP